MRESGEVQGTLGDLAGRYRVWLHCSCGHGRKFDPEQLAERLGRDLKNAELVRRAKCERCGNRAQMLTLEPRCALGYSE